jgi:heterodisulfide reductase subunit A-like polyferredoxin
MLSLFLALAAVTPLTVAHELHEDFKVEDTITKDVVIIGGGSSGTYGAVRLREDYNKSIIIVEKEDHLVCPTSVTNFTVSADCGVRRVVTSIRIPTQTLA